MENIIYGKSIKIRYNIQYFNTRRIVKNEKAIKKIQETQKNLPNID